MRRQAHVQRWPRHWQAGIRHIRTRPGRGAGIAPHTRLHRANGRVCTRHGALLRKSSRLCRSRVKLTAAAEVVHEPCTMAKKRAGGGPSAGLLAGVMLGSVVSGCGAFCGAGLALPGGGGSCSSVPTPRRQNLGAWHAGALLTAFSARRACVGPGRCSPALKRAHARRAAGRVGWPGGSAASLAADDLRRALRAKGGPQQGYGASCSHAAHACLLGCVLICARARAGAETPDASRNTRQVRAPRAARERCWGLWTARYRRCWPRR